MKATESSNDVHRPAISHLATERPGGYGPLYRERASCEPVLKCLHHIFQLFNDIIFLTLVDRTRGLDK